MKPITPAAANRFGQLTREKLTSGEIPFRKAYIGAIVDRIEVDDVNLFARRDQRTGRCKHSRCG